MGWLWPNSEPCYWQQTITKVNIMVQFVDVHCNDPLRRRKRCDIIVCCDSLVTWSSHTVSQKRHYFVSFWLRHVLADFDNFWQKAVLFSRLTYVSFVQCKRKPKIACIFSLTHCIIPLPVFSQLLLDFYRAMLCIRGTSHGPVSVSLCLCLSQVGVLLKRLNVGSHHTNNTTR